MPPSPKDGRVRHPLGPERFLPTPSPNPMSFVVWQPVPGCSRHSPGPNPLDCGGLGSFPGHALRNLSAQNPISRTAISIFSKLHPPIPFSFFLCLGAAVWVQLRFPLGVRLRLIRCRFSRSVIKSAAVPAPSSAPDPILPVGILPKVSLAQADQAVTHGARSSRHTGRFSSARNLSARWESLKPRYLRQVQNQLLLGDRNGPGHGAVAIAGPHSGDGIEPRFVAFTQFQPPGFAYAQPPAAAFSNTFTGCNSF